jgi:ArsR family transcriptional regulator
LDNSEKSALYRLHVEFCKVLSDANRLIIINELAQGEKSVNELTQLLGLHQPNVLKHLGLMRENGLVE